MEAAMAEVGGVGPSSSIFGSSPVTDSANRSDMGRDEFLKLLTVQMKSQNPMKPTENAEFAAQLAQFSSLEQLTNMNTALKSSLDSNLLLAQSINNTMAANFIGKTVKASTNQMQLSGGQATFGYDLFANAESVKVTIRDRNGAVVKTMEASTDKRRQGENLFEWDGKDNGGIQLRDGTYTFSVEAKSANGDNLSADPLALGKITGVRFKADGAVLVLNNLEVPLGSVTEINE
jgi:flagellar basal-body rod modification protein FlgD